MLNYCVFISERFLIELSIKEVEMRKIIAFMMALVIVITTGVVLVFASASATGNHVYVESEETRKARQILYTEKYICEEAGIPEKDIRTLTVGNSIQTYCLSSSGELSEFYLLLFPVFYNEKCVLVVSKNTQDPDPVSCYGIDSSVGKYLESFKDKNVAVIYERDSLVVLTDDGEYNEFAYPAGLSFISRGVFDRKRIPEYAGGVEYTRITGCEK
jgi:hypothetical protein